MPFAGLEIDNRFGFGGCLRRQVGGGSELPTRSEEFDPVAR